ncbi:MAG: hypothetical protein ABIG90_01555 [bacterium]
MKTKYKGDRDMDEIIFDIGIMLVGKHCDLVCEGCFQKSRNKVKYLDLESHLIDYLQEINVKQCFVGGGEPLLHDRLETILYRLSEKFFVRYLLTHGNDIAPRHCYLNDYIETLVISIDPMHKSAVERKQKNVFYPDHIFLTLKRYGIHEKVRINSVISNLNELPFFLNLREEILSVSNITDWHIYTNTNSSISETDYMKFIDTINDSNPLNFSVAYKLPSENFIQLLIFPDFSIESYSFTYSHKVKKRFVRNILGFNTLFDLLWHIVRLHGKQIEVFRQMGARR